jgi:transcriptional regulator with XRE-family HTH domain
MKLGELLRKWRAMSELDLKQAGAQIGIAASTLMRIEQGKVPDGETLLKLMRWIFEPVATEGEANASH